MSIAKIVVTGGPCAGKTTALSRIQRDFSHLGYTVLVVPETATALISGGVAPWTCGTSEDYQKCQMFLQMQKELVFQQAAATMSADKILIVCDRGELDNKAYMTEDEFARTLDFLGATEVELRDGYDAVFHLVSAAKGANCLARCPCAILAWSLFPTLVSSDLVIALSCGCRFLIIHAL